jgi:hypothetical protein
MRLPCVHTSATVDAATIVSALESCGCGEWESARAMTTKWLIVESHLD